MPKATSLSLRLLWVEDAANASAGNTTARPGDGRNVLPVICKSNTQPVTPIDHIGQVQFEREYMEDERGFLFSTLSRCLYNSNNNNGNDDDAAAK